jgi:hypothetical protein
MGAFQGVGVLIFLYTLYSVFIGEVYAKDKASGRTVRKSDEPGYYWIIIVIYFGLSFACYFYF